MIHLGDITQISGYTAPTVDIITGGSPCQDLSVAGKRAGLAGERSGLFMEQVRIVKEMRELDLRAGRTGVNVRPRWLIWENVPGAFSSNGGKDFQAVLEEIIKVAEPNAPNVPLPDKGKWPKSGCLYDDMGRWSVAWRVHDAQFWGVPQRRKRISLVADFGGLAAPEVLFERKGVSWYSEPSGEKGQGTARSTEDGSGTAGKCLNSWDVQSKHIQTPDGVAEALYAAECRYGGGESYVLDEQSKEPIMLQSNQNNARVWNNGVCGTLPAAMGMGGGYVPMITENAISFQERAGKPGGGKGILIQPERTGALSTLNNQSVYCLQGNGIDRADNAGCNGRGWREDQSYTLNTIDRPAVYAVDALSSNSMKSSNPHSGFHETEVAKTLDCFDPNPTKNQGGLAIVQQVYDASRRHDYQPFGDVCETVQAAYGTGGNNQPLVVEPTIYNGENVTSPLNRQDPHPGDPCHTLGTDTRNYVVGASGFDGSMGAKAGNIGYAEEQAPTLNAGKEMHVYDVREPICIEMTSTKNTIVEDGVSPTLTARMGTGGNQVNAVQTQAEDPKVICADVGMFSAYEEVAPTSLARQYKDPPIVSDGHAPEQSQLCQAVRRLTPLECERLQGFPDGWTDIGEWVDTKGKKHKDADSPRYKALGNSIALPFWEYLARRICATYERPMTMASLFDGIGGFPLAFERAGAKAVWASEIEEFPIAVTKLRFPEKE